MKKIFTILFLFFTFSSYAQDTLSAGISYTEQTARKEAFLGLERHYVKYDSKTPKFFLGVKDMTNLPDNIKAIGENDVNAFRYMNIKCYNVVYKDDLSREFIYVKTADKIRLVAYIVMDLSDSYPKKYIKYNANGSLISVEFAVSEEESYIYNKNGKLIAHWKDKQGKALHRPVSITQNLLYYSDEED